MLTDLLGVDLVRWLDSATLLRLAISLILSFSLSIHWFFVYSFFFCFVETFSRFRFLFFFSFIFFLSLPWYVLLYISYTDAGMSLLVRSLLLRYMVPSLVLQSKYQVDQAFASGIGRWKVKEVHRFSHLQQLLYRYQTLYRSRERKI